MLTLLHALHQARTPEGPYHDPGAFTLAVTLARGARKAWASLVEWHWRGHRRAAG